MYQVKRKRVLLRVSDTTLARVEKYVTIFNSRNKILCELINEGLDARKSETDQAMRKMSKPARKRGMIKSRR
jgi:hypothetical protein